MKIDLITKEENAVLIIKNKAGVELADFIAKKTDLVDLALFILENIPMEFNFTRKVIN